MKLTVALFYIGQRRYQETSKTNHLQFLNLLKENYEVILYDFIKDSPDLECPYDTSGGVQVWDFYKALDLINERFVIKLRTDVWFTDTSMQATISEIRDVVNGNKDVCFIGSDIAFHYKETHMSVNVATENKIQDFVIIADKQKIKNKKEVMTILSTSKKLKSGNKTFKNLIIDPTRAFTVRCQMYLIRQEHVNPSDWEIAWDFVNRYREVDEAKKWFLSQKPTI